MQELSAMIYIEFTRILRRKLRLTFRDRTRVRKSRQLIQAFEEAGGPLALAALSEAAFKDLSPLGRIVNRAFYPDGLEDFVEMEDAEKEIQQ
jgi:hypothetical protein